MKNRMNSLLSLMLICSVQQAVAWNLAIKNMTEGELVGRFFYASCGTLERIIPEWKEGSEPFRLDNGGCCPYRVEVRSTTGPARGLEAKYFPPTTGLGISCQNNEVTFKLTDDKKQIIGLRDLGKPVSNMTNFRLFNTTNSQLVVTLKYTVAAACMPETKLVNPGENLFMQVGLCCIGSISLTARGGFSDGKTYLMKSMGGPTGCGTLVNHYVKSDAMGNLVVESQ